MNHYSTCFNKCENLIRGIKNKKDRNENKNDKDKDKYDSKK
jgi:hypothetical protein